MITKKEVISEYKKYCEEFTNIVNNKKDELKKLLKEANKRVVREELCSGSDLFLGYYNPSPSIDLVVGNIHRGKLVKRLTDKTEVTHKYGFDESDRLLTVEFIPPKDCVDNDERVVLEYDGNIVNLTCFRNARKSRGISQLARFEYDDNNRLISSTLCDIAADRCTAINHENYTYRDGKLYSMVMWSCDAVDEDDYDMLDGVCCGWISGCDGSRIDKEIVAELINEIKKTGHTCSIDMYRFYHDDDGYIVKYDAVDKNGESTTYEIAKSKRRRV